MKRNIFLLFVFIFSILISACSDETTTEETQIQEVGSASASEEAETPQIQDTSISEKTETSQPENETVLEETEDISDTLSETSETSDDEVPDNSESETTIPDLSNLLCIATVKTAAVMNGFGNEKIGTRAYIEISKEELKTITVEQYSEFVDTVVKDSGYNWFTIFCDDGTGICFAGSMGSFSEYGNLDSDGSIIETIGYITVTDDGYSYEPAE